MPQQRRGTMAKDTATERRDHACCPICGRATGTSWRPFCSRRCADLDLGRWLTGAYAVPSDEEVTEGDAEL